MAFQEADQICLAQAFDQAKINADNRFSSEQLANDIIAHSNLTTSSKKTAAVFPSADDIVKNLKSTAHSGDVIVIMSNGGFDGIYAKLLSALA